jgi:hypothetical protein
MWTVATTAGEPAISLQAYARPISYAQIDWRPYDLILVFGATGHLVGEYAPADLERAARLSDAKTAEQLVDSVREHGLASSFATHGPIIPQQVAISSSATYPPGVVDDLNHSPIGIFPASGELCCWIGDDAQFAISVGEGPRTIALNLYLPALGPTAMLPSQVSIVIGNGRYIGTYHIRIGEQTIAIHIPNGAARSGIVRLRLRADRSFTPKALGLNGDVRRLSIILLRAEVI